MPHVFETDIVCKECGGTHLQWERITNIFFWDWRVLRCRRCLDAVRVRVPLSTWTVYAIALAAAVWGWWSTTGANIPEQERAEKRERGLPHVTSRADSIAVGKSLPSGSIE